MPKSLLSILIALLGTFILLCAPAVVSAEPTTDVPSASVTADSSTTPADATSATDITTTRTAPKAASVYQAAPSFGQVNMELLEGFGQNCLCFFGTLLFALPLGLLISFCSMSKFTLIRAITKTIVWCIRGTPLMLQIIVVFYGPGLLGITGLDRITAALIAFVINYACYFSEIYRGGIESIPKGQYEAGQVLGMTKTQIFSKIVLLQVVKRILPPMSNEIITLIKDTSLVRVIAIADVIFEAEEYAVTGLIWPLFYTAVFFLAFCGVLTLLFGYFEKKLSYFN